MSGTVVHPRGRCADDGEGARRLRRFLVLVVAALFLAALVMALARRPAAQAAADGWLTLRGEAMATTFHLTLPAGREARRAAEEVFASFRQVEEEMNEWRPGTPLAEVNRLAGEAPVVVPPALLAVTRRGLEIAEVSGGAFDPTWAALWGLWDFGASEPRLPDAGEAAGRAALVDWRRVAIDEAAGTLFLPAHGMKIGLGGIAKGWALDRAAEILERRGIEDYLLQGGGQVLARGRRGERPWTVGIRDPRGPADDVFASLAVLDASLSTSADSERFFVVGGERYPPAIDPRTGWPARGLRSATVIAADATLADALSTAILVLGRRDGLALASQLGAEAVLVDETGRLATTPGLLARLELRHPPRP